MQREKMPSKKQILKHWAERLIHDYGKYSMDIYEDEGITENSQNTCFACGTMAGTLRCHIVPYHLTKNNDCENLHLLCNECHNESEGIETAISYFKWFAKKDSTTSGSLKRLLNLATFYAQNPDCAPDSIKATIRHLHS